MAAEEDNFEIDEYGDGEHRQGHDDYYDDDEHTFTIDEPEPPPSEPKHVSASNSKHPERTATPSNATSRSPVPRGPRESSTSTQLQGVKRKESPNDRPADTGATTALLVTELHWWITEDDLRGWVNQAGAEDDLKEITFNEHKVNGKSKGLVTKTVLRWI
jgi:hypothetical protein